MRIDTDHTDANIPYRGTAINAWNKMDDAISKTNDGKISDADVKAIVRFVGGQTGKGNWAETIKLIAKSMESFAQTDGPGQDGRAAIWNESIARVIREIRVMADGGEFPNSLPISQITSPRSPTVAEAKVLGALSAQFDPWGVSAKGLPASVVGPRFDSNQVQRFISSAPRVSLPGSVPGPGQQPPIAKDTLSQLQRIVRAQGAQSSLDPGPVEITDLLPLQKFFLPGGGVAYFVKDSFYIDQGSRGWEAVRVPADVLPELVKSAS